jgi:hypothetical protein
MITGNRTAARSGLPGLPGLRKTLFAQDRAAILQALNQAVSRLHAYESNEPDTGTQAHPSPRGLAEWASNPTSSRAITLAAVGPQRSDLGGATWT